MDFLMQRWHTLGMKNANMLYGAVGFLVGVVITCGFYLYNRSSDATVHEMSEGSMIQNTSTDMETEMQGMMAGLAGKTGDAFDKEFLAEMIVHHQGAVDMAHAVLATSKRPELLKLANDIIAAQTKEIGMMQEWQKAWFK